MPIAALIRPALLASAAVTALAACQSTSPTLGAYDYGNGLFDSCVAQSCETLGLDFAPLEDYGRLNALSHVQSLMLGHTDFASLSDIAGMGQLRELHVGNTRLTDLSGLATFGNLRLLHIQNIQPVSWEPVAALTGLRELAIGHANMSDFSIIADLPRLQRLHIANAGPATDLSGLGRHRGLQAVHLDGDDLADLSPLLRLPNLRTVSLVTFEPERHADVIAQLRARGVTVDLEEPAVIVC